MKSISELMSLKNRTAVITGGAGHIGYAMAESLAEAGAHIAIIDMDQKKSDEAAKKIADQFNTKAFGFAVDLEDEKQTQEIPTRILEKFKGIHILINSAAFVGTSNLKGWVTDFKNQSIETWRRALEVNLTSPFNLIQTCAPFLKECGHGSIINIGSTYGVVGPDMSLYDETSMGNPAAYAASKGGLVQLTRWLSTVLAPHIRVNSLCPGGVFRNQPQVFVERYTKKTPLKRMATEEDFKGAAVFLASDLSNYVTGHCLMVDGGWTAW